MDQVLKENILLKEYIFTLEHENESRNQQRKILTSELDRLTHQLQALKFSSKQEINSTKSFQQTSGLQNHINILQSEKQSLIKQLNAEKNQSQHFRASLQNKIQILSQQNTRLNSIIEQYKRNNSNIKQIQNQKVQKQNDITKASIQITSLKKQIGTRQENYQKLLAQFANTQKQKQNYKQVQKQLRTVLSQQELTITQLRFEAQNNNQEIIRLRQRVANQTESSTDRYKNDIQIKELKSQINQLKYEQSKSQRQKLSQQNKIRQLQNQSIQKSSIILRLQKEGSLQSSYQTNLIIKQKQITTITTLNQNLKEQIQIANQNIRKKDNIINQIQNSFRQIQNQHHSQVLKYQLALQHKQRQKNALAQQFNSKIAKINAQLLNYQQKNYQGNSQEIEVLSFNLKQLEGQRKHLQIQSDNYQTLIAHLRKQNQTLKQGLQMYQQSNEYNDQYKTNFNEPQRLYSYQSSYHKKDNEIMHFINQLKDQLTLVKLSNKKMADQNQKMQNTLQRYIQSSKVSNNFQIRQSPEHYMREQEQNLTMGQQFMGRKYKTITNIYPEVETEWMNRHEKYDIPIAPNSINASKLIFSSTGERGYEKKNTSIHQIRSSYSKGHEHREESKSIQKMTVNKQKWQNLQKKINALKYENEELKKTLFQ